MSYEDDEELEEHSKATEEAQPVILSPLEKLPKLNSHDDEVKALGLEPEVAEALGVGLASGVMRGHIGCPLYDQQKLSEAGINPVGYVGIPKLSQIWLPKNLRRQYD